MFSAGRCCAPSSCGAAAVNREVHQREVHRREVHRREVHRREVERRLAALNRIDLFTDLTETERRTIAERLTYSPVAQGEIITRQGNVAHWLYILTAGEADIVIEGEGSERRFISTLGAGSFFGEDRRAAKRHRGCTVQRRMLSPGQGLVRNRAQVASGNRGTDVARDGQSPGRAGGRDRRACCGSTRPRKSLGRAVVADSQLFRAGVLT